MPERVFVYVDETGDRGASAKSSPIFGMAAIIVDESGAVATQRAVRKLRADFHVPSNKVMSWKDHAKTHDRRRRAAEVLAAVDNLKVCYVYTQKSELRQGSYRDQPQRFYNYVAYKTYKNALWAARNWKGANALVHTRFSHVRRHDHRTTERYIRSEASTDSKVPFEMETGLRWVTASQYRESQAADLFGGFLKAALWPDGPFNYVEPSYLLTVWSKIRNSETCAIPLGLMSMPESELVTREAWFPCAHCRWK